MVQDNPFRFIIPLQHITKVRIVEILWKTSKIHQILEFNPKVGEMYSSRPQLIAHLQHYVHQLTIPASMKKELMLFVIEMIQSALDWLRYVCEVLRDFLGDADYGDMYEYFVANMSWDNMGCINSNKIIESYVSNKDTVDRKTWKLLCEYCMESEIMRLSGSIDWTDYRYFDHSALCIYWYWKLHGQHPTIDMFHRKSCYPHWIPHLFYETQDGGSILQNFFKDPWVRCSHTSAIKYLRKELNDDEKFPELYLNSTSLDYYSPFHQLEATYNLSYSSATHFYLLRELQDQSWLDSEHATRYICHFAVTWPLVLFTEYWMEKLESREVLPKHCIQLCNTIKNKITWWDSAALAESDKLLLEDRVILGPFKEAAKMFNRKFGSHSEGAYAVNFHLFEEENIALSNIVFDAMGSSSRGDFLEDLMIFITGGRRGRYVGQLNYDDYCKLFMREVLRSEKERQMFADIIYRRRPDWRTSDSE